MAYGHRSRSLFGRAGIPLRVASAILLVAAAHVAISAAGGAPTRAFWISPSAMASAANIRRAVSSAVSGGFDAVIAPLAVGVRSDFDFDGATELLRQARERGLAAHLSVSVNVAVPVGELPASRDHVIYQHPEWLMVPRQLAPEMLKIDLRSPAYLGQIARWTRANADRVDGLYISPLDPAAALYLVSAIAAAVGRHSVDGVYLDALDFPGEDFDYSRHAMDLFRGRMRSAISLAERVRLDAIEAIDPFAYAEEFPEEWRRFRESALTSLLEQLRTTLKAISPAITVAAGARADADAALRDHFQAWRSWLDRGIVDRIGYRSRSTGTVLLSPDGVFASGPERPSTVQTAGAGGPQ
jgi:uncharacterized lipoprotein YddW (UPF0748 family)